MLLTVGARQSKSDEVAVYYCYDDYYDYDYAYAYFYDYYYYSYFLEERVRAKANETSVFRIDNINNIEVY